MCATYGSLGLTVSVVSCRKRYIESTSSRINVAKITTTHLKEEPSGRVWYCLGCHSWHDLINRRVSQITPLQLARLSPNRLHGFVAGTGFMFVGYSGKYSTSSESDEKTLSPLLVIYYNRLLMLVS